jgi:TRAP-type C4-dicarboxylate transport system permease large subunit
VSAAVTGANAGRMFRLTLPFFAVACVLLVLLSIFPSLSLALLK